MKGLVLKFEPGVAKKVVKDFTRIVEGIKPHLNIEHNLIVRIVPGCMVKVGDSYGFGCFSWDGKALEIIIAGKKIPGLDYKEWIGCQELSFCHELAHYEQYRDGKKLQERGIAVRARKICRGIA